MKSLSSLFWHPAQGRLRLIWRLAIQFLLMGALLITLQAASLALAFFTQTAGGSPASAPQDLIAILAGGLAVAASVSISARILDKRRFKDLGFLLSRAWWADFAFGLGLGGALMLALFLAELSLGWIRIRGSAFSAGGISSFPEGLLISLIAFCAVGFYEELYSRGYLIKNLSEGLAGRRIRPQWAILLAGLLTSIYFGLLHTVNPNPTPLSVLNISLAGVLLSAGYLITGQLGLSIGLHISWNFFQGAVFGFPVSGSTALSGSMVALDQLGPDLWTGGSFGPEGGLTGSLAIAFGFGAILLWKGRQAGIELSISRFHPQEPPADDRSSPPASSKEQAR